MFTDSQNHLGIWTKASMILEEEAHHVWYRRLARGIRRMFISRARRKAEIEEENKISQQVLDIQI